ncbi:lipid II-degrading bacteriocin [Pseudomonas typographi]|uniref:Lipid II-degrading bacteriocin n=1 Tax=Pseudomonas typographi TaxID=2715964 RepID=A0ABR7Z444_9PSED|nr:lipid II-degrading bacteriocin [Pseudomonas typographi]MBD1600240.1 lipid II-degrading bacteriocin [Pseudomonas typographi]
MRGERAGKKANQISMYGTPTLTEELSGNTFTIMKAYSHYLMGKGVPLTWRLENTGITPTVAKLPDLQRAISLAGTGITNIDINMAYDAGLDSSVAKYVIGNITIRAVGKIVRPESGPITFNGEIRAYNDLYDFDKSTHRSILTEAATTAGRLVGQRAKATPYEIQLPGAIQYHIPSNN